MDNKKVSFIAYFYPVFMSPSILNIINTLLKQNIEVDLYLDRPILDQIQVSDDKFKIKYYKENIYSGIGAGKSINNLEESFIYKKLKRIKLLKHLKNKLLDFKNFVSYVKYKNYVLSNYDYESKICFRNW